MSALLTSLSLVCFLAAAGDEAPGSWAQFRGPGGAAIAVGNHALPTEIGPKQYVAWKTPLPVGHSSPVIHGDRIFLTGAPHPNLRSPCPRSLS